MNSILSPPSKWALCGCTCCTYLVTALVAPIVACLLLLFKYLDITIKDITFWIILNLLYLVYINLSIINNIFLFHFFNFYHTFDILFKYIYCTLYLQCVCIFRKPHDFKSRAATDLNIWNMYSDKMISSAILYCIITIV